MIAKIGKGDHLYGAISYNQQKIDKENGNILLLNKIPETLNNSYSKMYIHQCFHPYLLENIKNEKNVRHISLNPDSKDKVSDEQFVTMAQQYMQEMGYGDQPYIVFKHTDTERTHIHIVTVNTHLNGKKIPDNYDYSRSMAICRKLEQKYNLIPATEKLCTGKQQVFRPVDYRTGDIKSQIASVVRHLPKYYGYASLGAYNALLSLFNITAQEVKGELSGQPKNGLVYFALNERGEKTGNPFKASYFGKHAGLKTLEEHFSKAWAQMKNSPVRAILKSTIEATMHATTNENDFKKQLLEQGINTIIRRNSEGRIYGMTFIDHESRSVWNGSSLDKNLSANTFNDYWKGLAVEQHHNTEHTITTTLPPADKNVADVKEELHRLFDFFDKKQSINDLKLIEGLDWVLPQTQGEDYEERAFANLVKKKKKNKKPGKQQ